MLAGGGIPLAADVPYAPVIEIFRALAVLYPPAGEGLLPRDQPAGARPSGPARLLTRAARLPAPRRRVLQAAAVLGRSVRTSCWSRSLTRQTWTRACRRRWRIGCWSLAATGTCSGTR